jgi:hypothetical protein
MRGCSNIHWEIKFMNHNSESEISPMTLAIGYQHMAADRERELEAEEWCEALLDEIN